MKSFFKLLLFFSLILVGKFYKEDAAMLEEEKEAIAATPADQTQVIHTGGDDNEEKAERQLKARTIYAY